MGSSNVHYQDLGGYFSFPTHPRNYPSLRFWMFLCYPLYGCGEGGGVLVS